MHTNVPFIHRGSRMLAHDRVPVQPVPLIAVDREMIAEDDIAAEQRDALNDDAAGGMNPATSNAMSAACPMLPILGEELNVAQTL